MNTVPFAQQLPVAGNFDVIVVGGGIAGVSAALTVAREKKRVLLIEKSNLLGGLSTLGRVNFWEPLCNGCGRQVIKGMAEELLRLSIRYGYDTLHPAWKEGEPKDPTKLHYITWFSPWLFAFSLTELLEDEGVSLLFDSVVCAPLTKGDLLTGVVVSNKSGLSCYEASQFIDTTGDGDLFALMGLPCTEGDNYYSFNCTTISLESCKEAAEAGDIHLAYRGTRASGANAFGKGQPEDLPPFHGISAEVVNRYVTYSQRHVIDALKEDDRFSRDLVIGPGMPQIRLTRHLDADYVMRDDDLFRHFSDSIGLMGDPYRRGEVYEIPFRTLCTHKAPNLLTAGRCAGASEHPWTLIRVIPVAALTGQAAGFAAVQALSGDRAVYDADVPALQASMESAGNLVHFEDAWRKDPDRLAAFLEQNK